MKKIMILFVLLFVVKAFAIINELDSETQLNLDISSIQTILTHTPDGSNDMLCQAYIVLGSAGEPLEGSGGAFEFTMTIGGQTVQPSPQIAIFGTEPRASIWTSQFLVPTGEAVVITVESPNADTADVTAYLYDIFPVNVASGIVESNVQALVNNAITTASINDGAITDAKVANDVQVDVLTIETGDTTTAIASSVWNALDADYDAANSFGLWIGTIYDFWISLTITGGKLETDMVNLDGTAVKSTGGNIHALPGNI